VRRRRQRECRCAPLAEVAEEEEGDEKDDV
jgi:hypothetical protein